MHFVAEKVGFEKEVLTSEWEVLLTSAQAFNLLTILIVSKSLPNLFNKESNEYGEI